MTGTATVWLATALRGDRVLLVGDGWDEVAAALAHQGADVTRAATRPDDTSGAVDLADLDGTWPAVGVDLAAGADALARALGHADGGVVTRLDLTATVDADLAARSWSLSPVGDTVADDPPVWCARWERGDADGALAAGLAGALHLALRGAAAERDAVDEARRDAARAASEANRQRAAAQSRAEVTSRLADDWVRAQRTAMQDLTKRLDAGPASLAAAPAPSAKALAKSLLRRAAPAAVAGGPASVRRARPLSTPGWRVAVVGGRAADWLGDWVAPTVLAPGEVPDSLVDRVGGHLDALVIGPVDEPHRGAVRELVAQAEAADATVVGVRPGGEPWPGFDDACDVLLVGSPEQAGPRSLPVAAPIRPVEVNPIGFRHAATGLVTLVTSDDADLAAVRSSAGRHTEDEVELVGNGTERALPWKSADRASTLRTAGGVLDVPEAHTSPPEHARTLVGLAAAGVPIVAPTLPDDVADLLGPELAGAVRAATVADLADPTRRERRSVLQRRAALWAHTVEARWRRLAGPLGFVAPPRPSVSAVVVTNRPGHLDHCAEQLRRQTHRPLEVVLGLHGDRFPRQVVDAFVDRAGLPVTVVRIDGTRTLGEGLNEACAAASGTVVTKWDDDDWYGPDHVVDLVQALTYSGATIVGKGSEFVHLDHLDVTIRRFVGGAESGSRSLAGGTLALRRDDLAQLGWWRRIPRSVDQRLLDDVDRAGGRIHRTHGFGFVLARRASGHTWSVDLDYFLGQASDQWRGLRRDITGLDDRIVPVPVDRRGP